MTTIEYIAKKKALTAKFDLERNLIAKEYAFSNNTIKVGDIIFDGHERMIVESIKYVTDQLFGDRLPCCVYKGKTLTKIGTIKKRNPDYLIYQFNLKTYVH
jgi:hypothetical protein